MKKCLLLFALIGIISAGCKSGSSSASSASTPNSLVGKTVVWVGIDYSMVTMSPELDFRDAGAIFPDMLHKWNYLFIEERFKRLPNLLEARVLDGSPAVYADNNATTSEQIVAFPEDINQSKITPEMIGHKVNAYEISQQGDIGLVFIVDRMVKTAKASAIYIVYFDLSTREVLSSERGIYNASGWGFRNYWFGSIKRAEGDLVSQF